ncbi:MAG TPA: hypothetical protein VIU40_11630 [Geobacteraceae bacterium]
MKKLLTSVSVILLISSFLYPLFFLGVGRQVSWHLVTGLIGTGSAGIYLLYRFRKSL